MPQETPGFSFKHLTDQDITDARHELASPVEGADAIEFDLTRQEAPDPSYLEDELRERRQAARQEAQDLALTSDREAPVAIPGGEAITQTPEMKAYGIGSFAVSVNNTRHLAIAAGRIGDTHVLGYAHPDNTPFNAYDQQDRMTA
jgi:hypothetical protein